MDSREGPAGNGARRAALNVLGRVTGHGAWADMVMESEFTGLAGPDRALAMELVYGVLRNTGRLDWIIGEFSSVRTAKLERRVHNALRLGVYQLLFLTRVPARAAINETVNLVRRGGPKKAGFVNAVLRKVDTKRDAIRYPDIATDPAGHISVVWSHPDWLVRRWLERFGVEETVGLCRAGTEAPPRTIRVNTLVTDRDRLAGELARAGVETRPAMYSPVGLVAVAGGLDPGDRRYYIQDEASQLVPYLVSPEPGETVCDACAAPGGKATALAQLMGNAGSVHAVDRHGGRIGTVAEASERLGTDIVKTFEADASNTLAFAPAQGYDAILLDAPCTGLGVLRRTPDIKLRRTEEDIGRSAVKQKRLLANLSKYVKKGGRLVYSVCTFEPEETDGVIDAFLSANEGFTVEDGRGYLPPGCGDLVDERGFMRTLPHAHGMDGFFAVRLRRD